MPDERTTSLLAIRSAVFGLVSVVVVFLKAPFLSQLVAVAAGVTAIIAGIRGLIELRHSGGRLKGRLLAWTGITLGLTGNALVAFVAVVVVGWLMDLSDRGHCTLPRLTLAIDEYQDAHQHFPPAATYSPDGKPLLSWRVLILPYINQEELYREFHLDEAWDSPHNLTLLSRMPEEYAPPRWKRSKVPANHTVCQVLVGKGAAFEGREGLCWSHFRSPWETFLVVEAGQPVPWTKPEDIRYDPDGPLPDLRGQFKNGFRVALMDGNVRFVRSETSEAVLRWAISRDREGTRPPDYPPDW
jgi:nitroreductase